MLASVQANPVFDRGPMTAVRDPALITQEGVLRCFHTAVEPHADRYRLYVDVIERPDLRVWSAPRRLTTSELNFSSPGNVIEVGGNGCCACRATLCRRDRNGVVRTRDCG